MTGFGEKEGGGIGEILLRLLKEEGPYNIRRAVIRWLYEMSVRPTRAERRALVAFETTRGDR